MMSGRIRPQDHQTGKAVIPPWEQADASLAPVVVPYTPVVSSYRPPHRRSCFLKILLSIALVAALALGGYHLWCWRVVRNESAAIAELLLDDTVSVEVFKRRGNAVRGSGFFVNGAGDVLTDQRIIDGAVRIDVSLRGGHHSSARVRAVDRHLGLALLALDSPPDGLTPPSHGQMPAAGEKVLAVRATEESSFRVLAGDTDGNAGVQFTESILPSGAGPVMNMRGELVAFGLPADDGRSLKLLACGDFVAKAERQGPLPFRKLVTSVPLPDEEGLLGHRWGCSPWEVAGDALLPELDGSGHDDVYSRSFYLRTRKRLRAEPLKAENAFQVFFVFNNDRLKRIEMRTELSAEELTALYGELAALYGDGRAVGERASGAQRLWRWERQALAVSLASVQTEMGAAVVISWTCRPLAHVQFPDQSGFMGHRWGTSAAAIIKDASLPELSRLLHDRRDGRRSYLCTVSDLRTAFDVKAGFGVVFNFYEGRLCQVDMTASLSEAERLSLYNELSARYGQGSRLDGSNLRNVKWTRGWLWGRHSLGIALGTRRDGLTVARWFFVSQRS